MPRSKAKAESVVTEFNYTELPPEPMYHIVIEAVVQADEDCIDDNVECALDNLRSIGAAELIHKRLIINDISEAFKILGNRAKYGDKTHG